MPTVVITIVIPLTRGDASIQPPEVTSVLVDVQDASWRGVDISAEVTRRVTQALNEPIFAPRNSNAILKKGLRHLNLRTRAYHWLSDPEWPDITPPVNTVGELVQKSAAELLRYCHFGEISLNEVVAALDRLGLKLRGD